MKFVSSCFVPLFLPVSKRTSLQKAGFFSSIQKQEDESQFFHKKGIVYQGETFFKIRIVLAVGFTSELLEIH